MKAVAVITARGGSKRIPRKNIKEFCGKPVIAYVIEAALNSGIFDEVMVSTDDLEIKQIAQQYGATVPFMRSAEAANDNATTMDVLQEVLADYKKVGKEFDVLCCLYPCAPFVTAQKLKTAMQMLISGDYDAVIPVVAYGHPPQRAYMIQDNCLQWQYPEYQNARSQDLPKLYSDCGQYYLFRVSSLLDRSSLRCLKKCPVVTPETEAQDIDCYEDWEIAELKYQVMMNKLKGK